MKRTSFWLVFLLCMVRVNAQSFTSSNLPIIFINTNGQNILDEPKVMADMGIIFNANNARNNITDPPNHYNGKIGIEIRGQSSQQFPMKSYSIELRDNTGASIDKSLFGLPKESDWVLYAPYTDKTLMRNFLAYAFSRDMGHWSANCRYVEVVINNDYKGIYVFMEKIKRNSGRVNIPKMATTDITGDAATGGYIISIDKEANGWFSSIRPNYAYNGQRIQYSYVYPKVDAIVPAQQNYIKSYVDSFETALNGGNFQDKSIGWRKFADENSFIDFLIVNEVSRNVDGYRLSSYFYKDRASKNGKLVAGPVWDFDLAFRNANYCSASETRGWAYQFSQQCSQDFFQIPFWWDRFATDTAFTAALRCRWKALRQTSLNTASIFTIIDSVASLTLEARQRHFSRWPILGQYIWPNPQPIPNNYTEEISTLKNWMLNRLNWLDNNMPNNGSCFDYPADVTQSIILRTYPNPFFNEITLSVKSKEAQAISVQVLDATGRNIFTEKMSLIAGQNTLKLKSSGWAAGLYFLKYEAITGEKGTIKLMKRN